MNEAKNQQNALRTVLVTILITALIAGGGVYAWMSQQAKKVQPQPQATSAPTPAITPTPQTTVAAGTPVAIYTEQTKEVDGKGRTWPTIKIWKKVGDQQPALLADNIGKIGEYPNSFLLTPDNKALIVNLESKLQMLDLETKVLKDIFKPKKQVQSFIFSRDGKRLFIWDQVYASSNDYEYFIHSLDLSTGAVKLMKHSNTGGNFFFFSGEREDGILAVDQAMGEASVPWYFNPKTAELKQTPGTSASLYGMSSSTGKYVASVTSSVQNICNDFSGEDASTFNLIDRVTGKVVDAIGVKDNATQIVAFSPDDTKVMYKSHAPFIETPGQTQEDRRLECNVPKPATWYVKTIGGSAATSLTKADAAAMRASWYPKTAYFDAQYVAISDNEVAYVLTYKEKEFFRNRNKVSLVGYFVVQ